jgi:hypothetical protein
LRLPGTPLLDCRGLARLVEFIHTVQQFVRPEWLRQEPPLAPQRAILQTSRHDQDSDRGSDYSHAGRQLEAVHPGHGDIRQEKIDRAGRALEHVESVDSVGGRDTGKAFTFQDRDYQLPDGGLVIYNQNRASAAVFLKRWAGRDALRMTRLDRDRGVRSG